MQCRMPHANGHVQSIHQRAPTVLTNPLVCRRRDGPEPGRMMTFKQFITSLPDDPSPEEAQQRYKAHMVCEARHPAHLTPVLATLSYDSLEFNKAGKVERTVFQQQPGYDKMHPSAAQLYAPTCSPQHRLRTLNSAGRVFTIRQVVKPQLPTLQ